jgi:AraC-like DNA-binding protein
MPIDHQLEVSVGLTQSILDALRMEGVADTAGLLQEAGIDPCLLEKPENRVPFDQQQTLWRLAVERSDSPAFGLHFARSMQPTSVGLLGYMAMNCRTIDESFEAIVKYQFLAGQGGEFSLQRDGGMAYLAYTPINPEHPVTAQRVLAMLAATVSFGRWLVGEALRPQRVELTHERPDNQADYEEFFACPVDFGQRINRLVYDQATTQLAIPNASEDLLLLLSERANRLLGSLSRSSGIATRIASLLATQLNARVPDKSVIAAQLGMSERTLQRRLKGEGTSFQEILDNTRHYLARELLKNTGIPLTDVAVQLGFSEPSTFFRAFKKWEGTTPGQYRGSATQ